MTRWIVLAVAWAGCAPPGSRPREVASGGTGAANGHPVIEVARTAVVAPEGMLETDVSCTGTSCPAVHAWLWGPTTVYPAPTAPAGAHQHMAVRGLATGSYIIKVYRSPDESGEAEATALVDVAAGKTTRVELVPVPTGTGKPLHGVLKYDGGLNEQEVIEAVATCGDALHSIHSRRATMHAVGPFEIEDVPPGRCNVDFRVRDATAADNDVGPSLCFDSNVPDRNGVYLRMRCYTDHGCTGAPRAPTVIDKRTLEASGPR